MSRYYIKSDGKLYGLVDESMIREKIVSGVFKTDAIISADMNEWEPVQRIMEGSAKRITPVAHAAEKKPLPKPVLPESTQQENSQPEPPAPDKPKWYSSFWGLCGAALLAFLVIGGGITWGAISFFGAIDTFEEVCLEYQQAVGVVTITFEDAKHQLITQVAGIKVDPTAPIGTAWAIGKKRFVTNAHVAYGIQQKKQSIIDSYAASIVVRQMIEDAKGEAVHINTEDDLEQYYQRYSQKYDQMKNEVTAWLRQGGVRVRSVAIHLSHSNGKILNVTDVQIHSKYGDLSLEDKRGAYDFAILTTDRPAEKYFPLASDRELYQLTTGMALGSLGFPMEGIMANGNIDVKNPEASFKGGNVVKITNFQYHHDANPKGNQCLIHSIPAAGGASGSPIFLKNGHVVAIVWGVENHGKDQRGARISSAALQNYGTRIDALKPVEDQPKHAILEWLGEKNERAF